MNTKNVLLVANWDWVIYNFRMALAASLKQQGYDVTLISPYGKYVDELEADGFRWIEWPLERRSLNLFAELNAIWKLAQIYEQESPDLIHHDTIKPNLYGALAAQINTWRGVWEEPPQLLNSFMGIGFLFSQRPEAKLLRALMLPVMRFAMRRNHVFTTFSNKVDQNTFLQQYLVKSERTRVMISEFVNTERFQARPNGKSDEEDLVVLMAARLLWDKGVQEFVSAAQTLHEDGVPVEFWLAGEPDTETPGFVPEDQLREWDQSGIINWLGYCSDMPDLLNRADIAVLPTHYNEGLPRFLVEAAATGLPLVATDIEACRRVVEAGKNGFVIPKRSPEHLAEAVEKLVRNPTLRKTMGTASRKKAIDEFAEREVVEEWLDLYDYLLSEQ
ncbi:glycosyltransferase family 4 protein [Salisaeta longa]|uniref:glycosyltransferase family 4 protein n=1 Tax=Salisaeta longa TaxID=503170 RepID=UPI0003B61442|nr:glycosyltransferase family 4 protein [Salisaeta longa]